jgi:hypothetical protein
MADFWADYWSFKADAVSRLTALEKQSAVDQVHRQNVEKRLSSIEENTKWLVRLIVGGFLMAIVAYGLQGGFNIG